MMTLLWIYSTLCSPERMSSSIHQYHTDTWEEGKTSKLNGISVDATNKFNNHLWYMFYIWHISFLCYTFFDTFIFISQLVHRSISKALTMYFGMPRTIVFFIIMVVTPDHVPNISRYTSWHLHCAVLQVQLEYNDNKEWLKN